MLTDREIEYYVFTQDTYFNEDIVIKNYDELKKIYKTDLEGLDRLFFDKLWNKIALFSLKELEEFIEKIKLVLEGHFLDKNDLFYRSYFGILRNMINDLKNCEYGELSDKFNNDNGIKTYLEKELYEILGSGFSKDNSKIGFVIDNLNGYVNNDNK